MAFHNVPPNGFPDIPDIEDLEAVEKDIATLKTGKQNKTDNALETTDKTVVGSINEVKEAIGVVSGNLSGLDNQIKVDIDAPERHNILYASLSDIKSRHTAGTWTGNVYSHRGITFTFTAENDIVTSVTVSGTSTDVVTMVLSPTGGFTVDDGYKLSGCPIGGGSESYQLIASYSNTDIADNGNGATLSNGSIRVKITIASGTEIDTDIVFYPMVRPSWITDDTFAPYAPSMDTRLVVLEHILTPNTKLTTENLNAIITPGSYFWRSNDEPTNAPGKNACMLVIKHAADNDIIRYLQIVYSFNNDKLYFRRTTDGGTTWSTWATFDMTAVTT